jgi:hypothetical protein
MAKAKAKAKSYSQTELELNKLSADFNEFDNQVKDLTLDNMNKAPLKDIEPQTKISQADLAKSKDIYLKPIKNISSREKFNEKFRDDYNFKKEYVHFTAENIEIIGETIELWTKPFPGMPAEFWKVPVNTPIWGPRYLAEQIRGCKYHQLIMDDTKTVEEGYVGSIQGKMVATKTVQRLNAEPVSTKRSVFMGE